jgi:hypothetical protein
MTWQQNVTSSDPTLSESLVEAGILKVNIEVSTVSYLPMHML